MFELFLCRLLSNPIERLALFDTLLKHIAHHQNNYITTLSTAGWFTSSTHLTLNHSKHQINQVLLN